MPLLSKCCYEYLYVKRVCVCTRIMIVSVFLNRLESRVEASLIRSDEHVIHGRAQHACMLGQLKPFAWVARFGPFCAAKAIALVIAKERLNALL